MISHEKLASFFFKRKLLEDIWIVKSKLCYNNMTEIHQFPRSKPLINFY